MERKTKVIAGEGEQDILITRDFDLPLDLLFRAYTEAEIVEQWMGTKVLKLESRRHGAWQYETQDPEGNVVFRGNGVIHDLVPNEKIIRTFEMEDSPFEPQLEFLEFEKVTDETSRFKMHIVFRSAALRDQMLKLPFAYGLNMAHDRLQITVEKLK